MTPTFLPASSHVIAPNLQDAIERTFQESHEIGDVAKNTLKNYESRASKFISWCLKAHAGLAVPAEPDTIVRFTESLRKKTTSGATVKAILNAVVWLHRAAGLEDFTLPRRATRLIKGGYRTGKLKHPSQSQPVTPELMDDLQERIDITKRSECIALLGMMVQFDTATRVSDMVSLRMSDYVMDEEGGGQVLLRRSKNDQTGRGSVRFISKTTIGFRTRVLGIHGEEGLDSAVVPKIDGGHYSPDVFGKMFKKLLKRYDVQADITPHGMRVGYAIQAHKRGIDPVSIVRYVGWANIEQFMYYIRNIEGVEAGAKLAEKLGR